MKVIEGPESSWLRPFKSLEYLLTPKFPIVTLFLNAVEVPLFSAAVLAILIIGERNFFSHQVDYQTEPIASIGESWLFLGEFTYR